MVDILNGTKLVRAVMKDGSVWWVRPEAKEYYESLATAHVFQPDAYLKAMDEYNKMYWRVK
jgi:hypothetical protein